MPRILICEHNANVAEMMKVALQQFGFMVEAPDTPTAALELIQNSNFDAAIINPNLSGFSGLVLAEALQDKFPGTPVILVSSEFTAHTKVTPEWSALGVKALLMKPF